MLKVSQAPQQGNRSGFAGNWIAGTDGGSWSRRRRLMAVLRMAHRVLGVKRKSLGQGILGLGGGARSVLLSSAGSTGVIGGLFTAAAFGLAMPAHAQVQTGPGASATGLRAIAIGNNSSSSGQDSIAEGTNTVASAQNAIALGFQAVATQINSINIGARTAPATGALAAGAIAIGTDTAASGVQATAIGVVANASGANALAFGTSAAASGASAIALGTNADATNVNAVALGASANASAAGASALGTLSVASGSNSTAVGVSSTASANFAFAGGWGSVASAQNSVALGASSEASAADAVAVGRLAEASGLAATAVGNGARSSGNSALALGTQAAAIGDSTVAVGQGSGAGSTVANTGSVAVGVASGALVTGAQNTAMGGGIPSVMRGAGSGVSGTRNVALGVGDGTVAYDATLDAAAGSLVTGDDNVAIGTNAGIGVASNATTSIGYNARASANNAIAMGNAAVADAADAVAIGTSAVATGGRAVSIGAGNIANGNGAVAIGDPNTATGNGAVAQGLDNTATGNGSVAMGNTNMVGGGGQAISTPGVAAQGAVGIGYQNTVVGQGSVAIGSTSSALAAGAVAFGDTAVANNAGDVALGSGSTTAVAVATAGTTINGTSYSFAGTAPTSTVSVGASGAERTVTNVAAGRVDAISTDAINGSQLFATNQAVETLGQGWTVTAEGANATNVGETSATGNSIDFNNADGNLVVAKSGASNDVTLDLADDVTVISVTAGGTVLNTSGLTIAGGPSVTTTGINAGGLAITNVAAGVNPTDAVNVSQLTSATSGVTTAGMNFTGNDNSAGDVHRDLGQTLAIQGAATTAGTYSGGNIRTVTDPATGAVNIQLADAPTFGTVTVNDGGSGRITGVTAGIAATDAVNVSQLDAVSNTANLGWNIQANGDAATQVAPGDTVELVDGQNIEITRSGTDVTIATSADLVADSVTLASGQVLDAGGLDMAGTTITNLADGEVSVTSSEAVNGSQLFATNQLVNQNTTDIANLDGRVTTIEGDLTNINNGAGIKYFHTNSVLADSQAIGTDSVAIGPNAVANNAGDVALGNGSTTAAAVGTAGTTINGTNYAFAGTTPTSTVSVGAAGSERTITNVAAGQINVGSTDAINGSQLFATNQAVEQVAQLSAGTDERAVKYDWNDDGDGIVEPGEVDYNTSTLAGVGGTTLTNVAAGAVNSTSTDAINGSQLHGVSTSIATHLGGTSVVNADGTVTGPTYAVQGGNYTTVFDAFNAVDGELTDINTALATIINGGGIMYFHANSALADSSATGTNSVAIGPASTAAGTDAVSIGNGALASNAGDVALGSGSTTAAAVATTGTTINGTNYGFAGTTPTSTVSVGAVGAERTVTNVAAGRIGTTSTDAVNGSQLHATNQAVGALGDRVTNIEGDITDLTNDINNGNVGLVRQTGGSSGPITVGALTGGTSINVAGTEGDRVISGLGDGVADNDAVTVRQLAAAITNVVVNGAPFTSSNGGGGPAPVSSGTNSVAGGYGAVASGSQSSALGVNSSATGSNSLALGYGSTDGGLDNVVSVGAVGAERQITNVAAGTRPTDAVNLSQLTTGLANNLALANEYTDNRFNALSFDLSDARKDADAGTSAAMAVAGLPQPMNPGGSMIAGGFGVYRGETAFAVGLSKARDDGRLILKGGATISTRSSDIGANVGIGYQFGD